jgi:excinuclease ABC subunit C
LLYVGKAKNLKKRVSSYFSRTFGENQKWRVLIKKIAFIEHIVVANESDALLLENNLIKKHQPRYNVMLKDDKSFPWICVRNEAFPRVFSTRNIIQDSSVYYGPYTSVVMVRTILEMIRQLFPLRTCRLNLSAEMIKKNKYKVCLEYHLGNCKGPCIGLQEEKEYNVYIEQVHQILKGNIRQVIGRMNLLMKQYADNQKFEEAQLIKKKNEILEKYRSKSTIVNPNISNVDVFTIAEESGIAFVNYLKVINGAVIQAHTLEIKKRLDESKEELLSLAIIDIRQKIQSNAREILVPIKIGIELEKVTFIVPQRGDKKHLLELSFRNARYHQIERRKRLESSKTVSRPERIMDTIKKDLHMKSKPVHIECFDNSNLQGSNPVAACVVFRNIKPSKKDYRHFHIKTVTEPNDVASMQEVVFRRYKRMLSEGKTLPQLVVVDGGKAQLGAAVRGLDQLGIRGKIAVIGIAKRLEEIYFPGDKFPLYLDKNSETLKILQQLRNEAHRFGVDFHRRQRGKTMVQSELDHISGIGEKSKEALMKKFGSVTNVKQADYEDIKLVVGEHKAGIIRDYFLRSTT